MYTSIGKIDYDRITMANGDHYRVESASAIVTWGKGESIEIKSGSKVVLRNTMRGQEVNAQRW